MKSVAFVFAVMTGYAAMSFAVLKVFWRHFDVHFYAPGVAHPPQAGLFMDSILVFLICFSALCLVLFRAVVPALLTLLMAYFFEFLFLHDGHHVFWQYAFVVGAIVGQIVTLAIYLISHTELGRTTQRHHTQGPSSRRYMHYSGSK